MRARGLSLVEVVVAATISTIILGGVYAAFDLSRASVGQSGRTGRYVADAGRVKARTLRLLRDVPAVPNGDTPMPATLPTGWPTGSVMSPHRLAGAGNAPDELFFFTTVVSDLDADGLVDGAAERGLGAAGVVGDYYRVHVITAQGDRQLVRDLVDGGSGALRRREVLALSIDAPLTTGGVDDQRAFHVVHSGIPGDPLYYLRVRQGFVHASQTGAATVRKTHGFNVTARGS